MRFNLSLWNRIIFEYLKKSKEGQKKLNSKIYQIFLEQKLIFQQVIQTI